MDKLELKKDAEKMFLKAMNEIYVVEMDIGIEKSKVKKD